MSRAEDRRLWDSLERQALGLQGFTVSEIDNLIQMFEQGINPENRFAFHFTKVKRARKVLVDGSFVPSSYGPAGPGIYAGTIPAPSAILKFVGWGLFRKPVRIPIDPRMHPSAFRLAIWPPKTIVIPAPRHERVLL